MNKLKVAAQDLRDYLGSDKQGLDYLGVLTKVANEQRTKCATLQTTNTELVTNDKKLRGELDAVQMELAAVKAERDRERSKRESAELRERSLATQLAAATDTTDPDDAADVDPNLPARVRLIRQLLRRVKKHYKQIPGTESDRHMIYLDDFVKVHSSEEFMGLGMVVALLALVGYEPVVKTDVLIGRDVGWTEEDEHKFFNWFQNRVHYSKMERDYCIPTVSPLSLMPGDENPYKQ